MRVNAKQCLYDDPAVKVLSRLSKAALVDVLVDILRRDSGSCDDPVSEADAIAAVALVLQQRGDRLPK